MPKANATSVMTGVDIKFPRLAWFQKNFVKEARTLCDGEELESLDQYGRGKLATYKLDASDDPRPFRSSHASLALTHLYLDRCVQAWALLLAQNEDWLNRFAEAIHAHAGAQLTEFEFLVAKAKSLPERDPLKTSFMRWSSALGGCIYLGWLSKARTLVERYFSVIDPKRFFFDGCYAFGRRRTQHFVLQLAHQFFKLPKVVWPMEVDEPLFEWMLQNWAIAPEAEVQAKLLAMLDRHTYQVRNDTNAVVRFYDFSNEIASFYFPYEVLAVLRFRSELGLPPIELDHVLTKLEIGRLPPVQPEISDELVDGAVRRAAVENQLIATGKEG